MMCFTAVKCRALVAFVLLLSVSGVSPVWAGYKVVLKDGTVIEAQSKPTLMEGRYRFTDIDKKFHSLSADGIDQAATEAANGSGESPRKSKVFTNEDFPTHSPAPAADATPETKKPEANTKPVDAPAAGKINEQYWRGEASKLRKQMAALDQYIETVKAEIKKAGSAGFDPQSGLQQNKIYIVDRESELKDLEKLKEGLQKRMEQLEEQGRKAGAPPAWFR